MKYRPSVLVVTSAPTQVPVVSCCSSTGRQRCGELTAFGVSSYWTRTRFTPVGDRVSATPAGSIAVTRKSTTPGEAPNRPTDAVLSWMSGLLTSPEVVESA